MGDPKVTDKIMKTIDEVIDKEISEVQLLSVIAIKKIENLIEKNMGIINNNFDAKCKYYNKSSNDVSKIKDEIISEYSGLFEDLEEEYMYQISQLIEGLKECQSNQKIAIANYKKILLSKEEYVNSEKYKEYTNKLEELQTKFKTSSDKSTVEQISEYLSNLEDPVEIYNKKIDALVDKYGNYCALEKTCIENINTCISAIESDMAKVMKFENESFSLVSTKKSIFDSIKSFISKLFKKGNFEKYYVSVKLENIEKLKGEIDTVLDSIVDNTTAYTVIFTNNKMKINNKYEADIA